MCVCYASWYFMSSILDTCPRYTSSERIAAGRSRMATAANCGSYVRPTPRSEMPCGSQRSHAGACSFSPFSFRAPSRRRRRVTSRASAASSSEVSKALAAWYRDVLGLPIESWGGAAVRYDAPGHPPVVVWNAYSQTSTYVAPSTREFMLDFAVDDMDAFVARLTQRACPFSSATTAIRAAGSRGSSTRTGRRSSSGKPRQSSLRNVVFVLRNGFNDNGVSRALDGMPRRREGSYHLAVFGGDAAQKPRRHRPAFARIDALDDASISSTRTPATSFSPMQRRRASFR